MFADPLSLPSVGPTGATTAVALTGAGSAPFSFVCTGRGPLSSTYRLTISSTRWIDLTISRQIGKRSRYSVRFTEREVVADPINDTLNSVRTCSVYSVIDFGPLGVGTSIDSMMHWLAYFLYKPTDADQVMDRVIMNEET